LLHAPIQTAPLYRVNPDLDLEALARTYREEGRVRIYGLLDQGSIELHRYFEASDHWIHLIGADGEVLELDKAARAAMSPAEWGAIEEAACIRARDRFQYRYQALRVPEDEEIGQSDDPLTAFALLMQSEEMIDLLRAVTGFGGLAFTDGQATAYGPGDFLTAHDDDVAGKNRVTAYVYGLTPHWRVEYGGMLLFHGEADRTVEGLAPRFNTLDLFSVPQRHSVSMVTPSAPHRRYAVTGWLRAGTAA
jgi:Rps23 Pro-64 3,4-dihydroxylase Tpa1-like proline 4-hydroxylase